MSSLIVSLPLEPATSATEWAYALTPDGRTLADHGKSPAALLPMPRGAGAEIVALVPVQAIAWHRVDLPKGMTPGTPRLRSALEGLLEEQLLDDTEAVHLALQPGARLTGRFDLLHAFRSLRHAPAPCLRPPPCPAGAPCGSSRASASGRPCRGRRPRTGSAR